MFTENDYKILKAIIDRNDERKGLCRAKGTTIKEIIYKTRLSEKKVRDTIKKFIEVEFITNATKVEKAKTYMLTTLGFKELNSLRINIFEEEEK